MLSSVLGLAGIMAALWIFHSNPFSAVLPIIAGAVLIFASALTFAVLRKSERAGQINQDQLDRNREQLQNALQAANIGTWEWDIEGGNVTWSDNVEAIFGLRPGEFAGTFQAYMDLLPADEKRKMQVTINNTLDSGDRRFHVIHTIRTRENETRWLEGRGLVERDPQTRPVRITGTVMDITARVRAESERALLLGRMEKRNTHLITAARVSKFCNSILDLGQLLPEAVNQIVDGFELYYVGLFLVRDNQAALQAGTGEAGRLMMAENFTLAIDERSMIGWSILHGKARIAQRAQNDEVRHLNPLLPGTRSEMSLPLVSRDRVIGALTVQSAVEDAFTDSDIAILQTMSDQLAIAIENARLFSDLQVELTQRVQSEKEREALIGQLEAKNAELERFTYTVSHDLKSPLITIRGFLGHLVGDAQKGDLARMEDDARRISEATNRMQRLLDELLELSRIGRLVNPPEILSMEQAVREALTLVEGRLQTRNIEVRVASDLPRVHADKTRLVEALQNLLDNAAKFMGDQKQPLIEIGWESREKETVFFVRDNGIGVDPKYHNKVFGLFDKLNASTEGTGVGLALVKRIIEVHGGHIRIESEPGKGATFYFNLPLAEPG